MIPEKIPYSVPADKFVPVENMPCIFSAGDDSYYYQILTSSGVLGIRR